MLKKVLLFASPTVIIFCLMINTSYTMDQDYPFDEQNFSSVYREFVPEPRIPNVYNPDFFGNPYPDAVSRGSFNRNHLRIPEEDVDSFRRDYTEKD